MPVEAHKSFHYLRPYLGTDPVTGEKQYGPVILDFAKTTLDCVYEEGQDDNGEPILVPMDLVLAQGAQKLKVARSIAITGKATAAAIPFDGSADVTLHVDALDISASAGAATPLAPAETAALGTSNLYAREDHQHPAQADISGNAGTATKLATARAISLAGGATGSATFDGSADVTITVTPEAGTGLEVGADSKLSVAYAAQDDTTSEDKAVTPAYVATVVANLPTGGGSGGNVDEAAVRRITLDVLDNYDFSINDTVVLNAVNKVLAGTDVGQINQRLDTLEAAFNVGGSSSTPYPGVSAIIAMEVPNDDFFLVSGIHDVANKRLMI